MTYRLHPSAAAEHFDSVAFYESRTPGLGADYLAEFEGALRRVVESPLLSPIEVPPEIRIAHTSTGSHKYAQVRGHVFHFALFVDAQN